MDDNINMYFTFTRENGNRNVRIQFTLNQDAPWRQILPFFLDFLKANGYPLENNHELYGMCDYVHE